MRTTLALFTLAAISQTAYAAIKSAITSAPPTDIGKSLPVVSIHSVTPVANKTLSSGRSSRIHAALFGQAPPAGTFPATLLMCTTSDCISCFPADLSTFPTNMCLAESFSMQSVAISQPSDEGLPDALFIGQPGCTAFQQIPAVNQCFNLDPTVQNTDVALN
ncbi:hypothetical protein TRAPUB_6587 [Trametes pubescens]|uniref:Uncharacterized protein n=1 Tax=Trametes pubescens TaxID=154538 RepID=A0A1M2V5U9_TRAPU|nr:hypothetical protein TRAPUB_6587 [Trametes pubescens]